MPTGSGSLWAAILKPVSDAIWVPTWQLPAAANSRLGVWLLHSLCVCESVCGFTIYIMIKYKAHTSFTCNTCIMLVNMEAVYFG